MTATALRVPRTTPLPSPQVWVPNALGIAGGWSGNTVNAAYFNGKTYVGFCDGDGKSRIAAYAHSTDTWALSPAILTATADIHCTPSVLVRSSDHKIVVATAKHDGTNLYIAVSTNAEDISAWGTATDISSTLGGTTYTYANLFQLSGETGKIHLFYRDYVAGTTTGSLAHATSTDAGATWTAQTVIFSVSGKVAYWAIGSDDTARIDIVTSDGSAASGDTASAYHFYYSGGNWFKSDGIQITASLPFAAANVTKIYDGATNGNVRAGYDIATNGGNPRAVWAAYNSAGSGSNENYWYGSCASGTWTVNEITDSGSTPDTNFQEGGVAIDATDVSGVFVSKKTSSVWQIFRYSTTDAGVTWASTQLTADSAPTPTDIYNLRPRSPRNAAATLTSVFCSGPHFGTGLGVEPPAAQSRRYPNPVKRF